MRYIDWSGDIRCHEVVDCTIVLDTMKYFVRPGDAMRLVVRAEELGIDKICCKGRGAGNQ